MWKKKMIGVVLAATMLFGTCFTASAEMNLIPVDKLPVVEPSIDFDINEYQKDLLNGIESELISGAEAPLRGGAADGVVSDVTNPNYSLDNMLEEYFPDLEYSHAGGGYLFSIDTADELMNYRRIVNAAYWFYNHDKSDMAEACLSASAVLTADIDFTNYDWDSTYYGCWEGIGVWDGTPENTCAYRGYFEGNGHTITGIKVDSDSYMYGGFFGCVDGAQICNLALEDIYVHGDYTMAGLAGRVSNTTIKNCYVQGTIIADDIRAVGLLGTANSTTMENCYFVGDLTSTNSPDAALAICGVAGGENKFTNCYYEDTKNALIKGYDYSGTYDIKGMTAEQFKNGEVTYLLDQGVTDFNMGYYQTVGEGLPAFTGKTVYKYNMDGTAIYSNYSPDELAQMQNSIGSGNPSTDGNANSSPKTNDPTGGYLFLIVMALCLTGAVGTLGYKKVKIRS